LQCRELLFTVETNGGKISGGHGNCIAGREKDRPHFCAIKIKGFVYILAYFRDRSDAKSRALFVDHAKAALIVRAA
jgi:hypothetical protein